MKFAVFAVVPHAKVEPPVDFSYTANVNRFLAHLIQPEFRISARIDGTVLKFISVRRRA